MVFTTTLIADVIVNIILFLIGCGLAGNYQDGLLVSSLGCCICIDAAYFASYFLGGHPSITGRMIVAAVLGLIIGNLVAAVLVPAMFGVSCLLLQNILARFGIIRF